MGLKLIMVIQLYYIQYYFVLKLFINHGQSRILQVQSKKYIVHLWD